MTGTSAAVDVSTHPPRDSFGSETKDGTEMNAIINLSRRNFLKTKRACAGRIGFSECIARTGARGGGSPAGSIAVSAERLRSHWPDDTVTVIVITRKWQGPYTSIPMMVAEELDADWNKVPTKRRPSHRNTITRLRHPDDRRQHQHVVGMERVRKAGAAARQMLLAAAGETWGVSADTCRTENNQVIHGGSGRKLSYGDWPKKRRASRPPKSAAERPKENFKLVAYQRDASTRRKDKCKAILDWM